MNEETFHRALNHVDSAYVEEYLEESGRAKKRRILPRPWQKALAAAACLAVIAGVCGAAGVFRLRPGNAADPVEIIPGAEHTQPPTPDTEPPSTHDPGPTAISSDPAGSADTEPEASWQRLSVDTFSYFKKGDIVPVSVGMGDIYTLNQETGYGPGYDTYGENGYPFLLVYDMDRWNRDDPVYGIFNDLKDGSRLLVNGEAGRVYEKRFTKEEMADLDISKNPDVHWMEVPPEQYHRETVYLDFSEIPHPWHGCVLIVFGWYYEHGDPNHPDRSMEYKARQLWYYVGEEGVGLSFVDDQYAVDAQKEGARLAAAHGQIPTDVFIYGTFSGCQVELDPGLLCVMTEETVAGYSFKYSSSFVIYAISDDDGQVYELSEAYEKGLLTEQDLAEIYRIHRESVGEELYQEYGNS